MIKALERFDQDELNKLAKRTSVIRMPKQNKEDNQQYTLTRKSTATISNDFVALHNAFNKILSGSTNVKELQKVQTKSDQNKNISNVPAPVQIIGAEDLGGNIKVLGKYFESLTELLKKLDLNPDKNNQEDDGGEDDTVIDAGGEKKKKGRGKKKGKARGRKRGRSKLRGRGLGGKALGIFAAGMDLYDRLSDGESATQAGVGVAGGVAGGWAGAEAGAALGTLGGPAAPITVPLGGLIGGAIGYFAGGKAADAAYGAVTKESPADKRLEVAASKASVAPAVHEPSKIGNNSYSSRFAAYLSDTFDNVKNYISGLFSQSVDSSNDINNANIYDPSGGPLSGNTKESFANIVNKAAALGDPYPEITAAQWALESGYGQHMPPGSNNPFGQMAGKGQPYVEAADGHTGHVDRYVKYDSIDDALKAHIEKWNKKIPTGLSPSDAIQAIVKNGYNPNPDYPAKVLQILSSNNIAGNKVFNREAFMQSVAPMGPTGPLTGGQLMNPVPSGRLTSLFGDARDGGARKHMGIDLAAPIGTPIIAAAAGKAVLVGVSGAAGGNRIRIDHGGGLWTSYEHLSRFDVREGQDVAAGQVIGRVGNTGIGTGPHLHFTVWKDGKETNPLPYITAPKQAQRPEWKQSANWQQVQEMYYGPKRRGNGSLLVINPPPQSPPIPYPWTFGTPRPKIQNPNPRGQYLGYHNQ